MYVSANSQVVEDYQLASPDFVAGRFREHKGYRVMRKKGVNTWLLILTVDGRGIHRSADKVHVSHAGTATLWEPAVFQEYFAEDEGWELAWAHFWPRPHWRSFMEWPEVGQGCHAISCDPGDPLWQKVLEEFDEVRRLALGSWLDRELARARLECCLLTLRRAAAPESSRTGDSQMDKALEWAISRLDRPLSVGALASKAGMSTSNFAHRFREAMGEPPRMFIERQRLEKARHLLAMTNLPVKTVARQVGFSCEFYFSNRFRQAEGVSPSEFRRVYGQAEKPTGPDEA